MSTINELLHKFCEPEYNKLAEPWSYDSYSFASDGHIAIRVPRVEGIDREPPFGFSGKLPFTPGVEGEWVDLPAYELPPKKKCHSCKGTGMMQKCPECDGDGSLEFSNGHHEYEVECLTCRGIGHLSGGNERCENCDGSGEEYEENFRAVPDFGTETCKINAFLLDKIKDLPGVKMFSAPTGNMFHFRFDGGDGVAMALRN
jgi:hypothetical protein